MALVLEKGLGRLPIKATFGYLLQSNFGCASVEPSIFPEHDLAFFFFFFTCSFRWISPFVIYTMFDVANIRMVCSSHGYEPLLI